MLTKASGMLFFLISLLQCDSNLVIRSFIRSTFHPREHALKKKKTPRGGARVSHLSQRLELLMTSDDLRPLGKISLIGDPSLFISANCVVDICTPGHVGKHIKQVCKLLWWQGTVLVLMDTNVGFGHLSHLKKKYISKFVLAVMWIDSCLAEWTPPTCTAETHFTERKLPFILFDFHPNLTAKSPVNPSPLTRP